MDAKPMKRAAMFALLLIPRLCIPFSFLLAIVFSPVGMLMDLPNWPRRLADMWDDPL